MDKENLTSNSVDKGQATAQVEQVDLKPHYPEKKENKFWIILKKLSVRWFIDAFSGMALGLFATLIAGTIIGQLAKIFNADSKIFYLLNTIATIAKSLMGAGIGVGIAYKLKGKPLVIFTGAVAGLVGAFADVLIAGTFKAGGIGNPIGAYVVALIAIEIASLYAGKTKFDIILIPLGMILLSFVGIFAAWPFIWVINQLGKLIAIATKATPFFMGIIISAIMGILLTMPTSSAAIWVAVASPVVTGFAAGSVSQEYYDAILLAGGAATVGCASQMVGFAVISFKENGFSGLISQGLGTSMLQIPNIMRNPKTFIPPIVASMVLGPVSTCLFKLKCNVAGGGMGTSGLVGVFGIIDSTNGTIPDWQMWIGIILLMFVLPALISWAVGLLLRKVNWIKDGDLLLPNN